MILLLSEKNEKEKNKIKGQKAKEQESNAKKKCWKREKKREAKDVQGFGINFIFQHFFAYSTNSGLFCVFEMYWCLVWGVFLWEVGWRWFILIVFGSELHKSQYICSPLTFTYSPITTLSKSFWLSSIHCIFVVANLRVLSSLW